MKKIIFLSLVFALCAQAQTPRSSAALGAGGGGAATSDAGEVSFLNPANLVHLKGRQFYTSLQKDLWAVSIVQNDRQSIMPGALSYFSEKKTQMISMSLAEFALQKLSFGASAAYWQTEVKNLDKRNDTAINGSVGMTWVPYESIGVGFVAQNVVDRKDSFKERGLLEPSSRFGINYIFANWLRWRLDYVTQENNRWDEWTPQLGFESYVNRWMILRAGYSKPTGLKESLSAGLGLDLPRFKLDYASQWNVNGTDEQRHSVDLGVPF